MHGNEAGRWRPDIETNLQTRSELYFNAFAPTGRENVITCVFPLFFQLSGQNWTSLNSGCDFYSFEIVQSCPVKTKLGRILIRHETLNLCHLRFNWYHSQRDWRWFKVHIPPLTKFRPETPCGVKRSHAQNFRNRNCGSSTIKLF